MIGVVDVEIQAKNPNLPLWPLRAYINSPSSIRLRNVPRKVGQWQITSVQFIVNYPDKTQKTAQCVLVGGVWVGTIEGSSATGSYTNGYTVLADGTDENGNPVSGYVLGRGDVEILKEDGTPIADDPTHFVTDDELDAAISSKAEISSVEEVAEDVANLANSLSDYYVKSETSSNAELDVKFKTKADLSALNEVESSLSDYYVKSETSSNAELDVKFKTKADLSALNEVADSLSDYYTKSETSSATELQTAFDEKQPTGDYALVSQIPLSVSQLENDSGYLTEHQSLSDYYTKNETSSTTEIQNALDGKQPTGDYALTSQLPTNVSQLENDAGYLTAHQPLSDYYTKSETSSATELQTAFNNVSVDLSEYYTKSETSSNAELDVKFKTKADLSALNEVESSLSNYYVKSETSSNAELDVKFKTKADLSALNEVESSLSDYYTKNETSSDAQISEALDSKAELSDLAQAESSLSNYLPLSGGAMSGDIVMDKGNKLVFGKHDDRTVFITDPSESDFGVHLSSLAAGHPMYTLKYIFNDIYSTGFTVENVQESSTAIIRSGDLYVALSSKADRDELSSYYTKSEISSASEVGAALNLKQDKLTDIQLSALNDIADEYMTIVKYNDNTISAYLVEGTLKSYNISSENKEIVDVKVGKLVTSIGNYAFENCANLTSFTMPDSVTVVNQRTFRHCNSLANLEFSSNISSIGSDSFAGCTSLTSVVLPEKLVELGSNVFTGSTGITEVVVPKSIASIGVTPFFGCTSLTSVTFVGKTLAQVQAMPLYPWGLNTSIIKTWNTASQEWVLEQLSALEARIAALENN